MTQSTVLDQDVALASTAASDLNAQPAPFGDQPIRYVRLDGLPWYAAADVCKALKLPLGPTLEEDVAEVHKRLQPIPTAEGFETGPVISPIGAWTLSMYLPFRCARSLDFQKWIFRETKKLQPDAFDRKRYGPAQVMALRPDGDVPPKPSPRSGRKWEWEDLRYGNEHLAFRYAQPSITGRMPADEVREQEDFWEGHGDLIPALFSREAA
jgi:hypothetical protein